MEQGKQYYAFISYKSEDVEWAIWLQHELEHYHLPASFNGRTDIRQELRPVFRDIDELSAGNLPEQIRQALKNSQNLIVVCSPQAAASPWVNQELETFISLGRTDRIFPFIVEGNAPKDFFPPALLALPKNEERLGGDASKQGRDIAFVKVVAGMLGLGFDSLWNRYEKEKAMMERKEREERERLYKIQSLYLSEKALDLQNYGYTPLAIRLSLEALPVNLNNPNRPYTPIAERVLRFLTCTQQATIMKHDIREDICSIAYNTKKKYIASASAHIIKIWSIETGQIISEMHFETEIKKVAFNQDGTKVIGTSVGNYWRDVCIYEWEIDNKEYITLSEGNEKCRLVVNKITKEDGVVLSHYPNTNILWDLFHDDLLKSKIQTIANKIDTYSAMIYSPKNNLLVFSQKKKIAVFDLKDKTNIYNIDIADWSHIKVDLQEEHLILAYINEIRVYFLKNGQLLRNANSIDSPVLAFSCNQNSTSITYATSDGVFNWNYITEDLYKYCGLENVSYINCFELLDNDSLICFSEDNNIRLIHLGYDYSKINFDTNVSKLAFSNDSKTIASICENGQLYISNIQSQLDKTGTNYPSFSKEARIIMFSPNDIYLAIASANMIFIYRKVKNCYNFYTKLQGHKNDVTALSFDKESKRLCSADCYEIKVWRIDSCTCLQCFHDDGQGIILSVLFHPSEAYIIATSYKCIKIWSIIDGNYIHNLSGHTNSVTCLANNERGNCIISGSCDNTLRVWDINSGHHIVVDNTDTHQDTISSIQYYDDVNYLLSFSDDGAIKIWYIDGRNLTMIYEVKFDEKLISAKLNIKTNQIMVATSESLYFIDFPPTQDLIFKYRQLFKDIDFTDEDKRRYHLIL